MDINKKVTIGINSKWMKHKANVIHMAWTTWAIWGVIKKYSLIILTAALWEPNMISLICGWHILYHCWLFSGFLDSTAASCENSMPCFTMRLSSSIRSWKTICTCLSLAYWSLPRHSSSCKKDNVDRVKAKVISKVSGHPYRWLAGGYDLERGHF